MVIVLYAIHRRATNDALFRLVKLNQMRASEELSEEQSRQLAHDAEMIHAAFYYELKR